MRPENEPHLRMGEKRKKKIYEIFTAVCSLGEFCVRVNSRTFLKMNKLQKKNYVDKNDDITVWS